MSILDQLLEKRKIKSVEDLDEQERSTYNAIKKELETEVTTGTIKKFCEAEIRKLQREWLDMDCKGLTDLTARAKELTIKARIKNYSDLISLFWKAENIKNHGIKKAKELISK